MRTVTSLALGLLLAMPARAEILPFEAAAGLVLERGLEREAARATLDGAQAYARRAGGLPGPSIAADVENFGGGGPMQGFQSAEITVSASQQLLFGPRAAARRSLARAEADLAAAHLDKTARAQIAALARLYAAADAAGQRAGIAAEREALANRLAANARRRLAAGDVAEVEAQRVAVEAALANAAGETARLEARAAQEALSLFVGQPGATAAPGWLGTLATGAPPPDGNPASPAADDALWAAERAVAARAEADARAERLPTADLMLGVRRLRETDATAAVAGVTLALPLWNGNRGAIARAASATRRADLDAAIKARDGASRQAEARAAWQAAAASLGAIEGAALPAGRRALELSQRGYAAGALPYRDLADATHTLMGIEEARIAALQAIADARASLLELTGDMALVGLGSGH